MKLLDDDVSWQRAWHSKRGKAEDKQTITVKGFLQKPNIFFATHNFTPMRQLWCISQYDLISMMACGAQKTHQPLRAHQDDPNNRQAP